MYNDKRQFVLKFQSGKYAQLNDAPFSAEKVLDISSATRFNESDAHDWRRRLNNLITVDTIADVIEYHTSKYPIGDIYCDVSDSWE